MDYTKVIAELHRYAEAQRALAKKNKRYPALCRQAETVAAVFLGMAMALEAGLKKEKD